MLQTLLRGLVAAAATLAGAAAALLTPPATVDTMDVFTGAWFTVAYPQGFAVLPGLPSATSTSGVDSVRFRSPDGDVTFYVFSPQWEGEEPTDFAAPARADTAEERDGDVTVRRATWVTPEGWTRWSEDRVDELQRTRSVVGIEYRDPAARARWEPTFQRVTASLLPLAD